MYNLLCLFSSMFCSLNVFGMYMMKTFCSRDKGLLACTDSPMKNLDPHETFDTGAP